MRRRSAAVALALSGALALGVQAARAQTASPPDSARAAAQAPARVHMPEGARPVLLVPGWGADARRLEPLRMRFVGAGWDSVAVRALSFANPVGSNRTHAREVERALDELRRATGRSRIDVVAHSMGGLAVRYYLRSVGSPPPIARVAFLATPQTGTLSARLVWGEGAQEMLPGSVFLNELARAPAVPDGVRALTVRSRLDLHILPSENATLAGVPDVEICCPTHAGLLTDRETFWTLYRFLTGAG